MFYLTSGWENKHPNNNALILTRWSAIFFKTDNTNYIAVKCVDVEIRAVGLRPQDPGHPHG